MFSALPVLVFGGGRGANDQTTGRRTADNFRCLCTGEKGRSGDSGKRLNFLGIQTVPHRGWLLICISFLFVHVPYHIFYNPTNGLKACSFEILNFLSYRFRDIF